MHNAIQQIGERLRGLRDVLDIKAEDVAQLCDLDIDTYLKMEDGEGELSISSLQKISKKYGIALDPFLVTVEPSAADAPIHLNSHQGQEFNYVTSGSLLLTIGKKTLTLNEGDSIYFDATQPHGMKAIGDKAVQFLAIIF